MTYRRAEHTAWRDLGDETVVVDLTAQRMIGLNPTAGTLWQALDGTRSLERLAEDLSLPGLAELERFCAELEELGLLEAGAPASGEETAVAPLPAAAERQPPTAPAVLWQEPIQQAGASCAFFPTQSPLCNQAPFS